MTKGFTAPDLATFGILVTSPRSSTSRSGEAMSPSPPVALAMGQFEIQIGCDRSDALALVGR